MAEGVFPLDKNEMFTYTNQLFCDMLGFSNSELSQMTLKKITTEDDFQDFFKHIR
jgi:PAS domain S-box-containing protein